MATEDTQPVHVPPPSTQKPSLGSIVLYIGLDGDVSPAIVVGLVDTPGVEITRDVNLQVFLDGGPHGMAYRMCVPFSTQLAAPNTWHWPPRV